MPTEEAVQAQAETEWAEMEAADPDWNCVFARMHDLLCRAIRAEMRLAEGNGGQCRECGEETPIGTYYCVPCRAVR